MCAFVYLLKRKRVSEQERERKKKREKEREKERECVCVSQKEIQIFVWVAEHDKSFRNAQVGIFFTFQAQLSIDPNSCGWR